MIKTDKIYEILKKHFGYDNFRQGQEDIIRNIIEGKDTLGVMPTGGGKSICYQIPALIFEGLTIVVSPLISLMEDQVGALNALGISSTYINSSLSHTEMRDIFYGIDAGEYKIIYIAPERLDNADFVDMIKDKLISQIAVDEAHCISQWGHDFRRSYLNIPYFMEKLKKRPVLSAFTATATPQVREDIVNNLKFDPNIYVNGFDRKNLQFSIIKGVNSLSYIKKYLKEHSGEGGIIYASTRKEVDSIYNELLDRGYKVGRYHAGMSDTERQTLQKQFVADELDIMVATNAFGMGIDKSNVRFVIHNNLTRDIESYYQEAGRAGRDGLEASCILIFNPKDILTQRYFIENNQFGSSQEVMDIKYEKLNAMVNYCHTSKCVRSYMIEYFGDEGMENCDNCSSCLDTGEKEDITIEAQKIISCIGRTKERFGVKMIVGILSGSRNKSILNWGLDSNKTYGLMSTYKQDDIRALVDLLIGDGYIEVVKGEFPTLRLTNKAYLFIKNKETLQRKVEKIEKRKVFEGEGFFDVLREIRAVIAKEEGKPPYTVFSDKTLREMAKFLPVDKETFLEINGVGEVKYERYGAKFKEAIEKIRAENPAETEEVEAPKKKAGDKKIKSHIITGEMYMEGNSIEKIAKERELTLNTATSHLIRCIDEDDMKLNLEGIVDMEKVKLIEDALAGGEEIKLKEIKEKLPENIEYYEINIVLRIKQN